jgi:hypothetical protein
MPARFTAPIELSASTLSTDLLQRRLAVVGPRYFGGKGPATLAGQGFDGDPMESRTLMFCVERKVMDGARHLYDAWFYMGDSGTFFAAGTADPIARVIQGGLQCDDPEVRAVLVPAMVEAKLLPSSDREFAQLVAQQQGVPKKAVAKAAGRTKLGLKKGAKKPATKKGKKKTPAPKTKVVTRPVIKKTAKKKPAPKKKAAKKTARRR